MTNSSKHYKALGWRSDQMLLGSKFLWRSGYVDCPDSLPKIKTLHDDFVNMLLTGKTTGGKVDPLS